MSRGRRTMTAEQQEAWGQRREQMRSLSKKIAAMSEAERQALAAQIGTIMTCEERVLSPYNTCMLASQKSDATIIGGFRQWKRLGRAVRKGEKASYIWVPMASKAEQPAATDEDDAPNEQRFRLVAVFDVGQTDVEEQAATETDAAAD